MRVFSLASLFFSLSFIAFAQIVPGQLPPGPPPQPGELGPAPVKPSDVKPDNPTPPALPPPVDDPGALNGDYTLKTTVRYVLVPTTVLDPDGHGYVNGLLAKDFEVYDNDKPQKVIAEATQQPMSVVLAVQANSDTEPLLPKIKKSATLLQGLVTGEDGDVAILAFDHRMQHMQDFTKDPDKLDDAMQKIRPGSTRAALIDAVLEADHMLRHHDPYNQRRRVVILISRNVDKGSEAKLEETVHQMQFDGIIVYCIDISKVLTAAMKEPDYPRPANGGIPAESMPPLVGGGGGPQTQTSVAQQSTGNVLSAVPPLFHSIRDLFKKTPAEAFTYFTGGNVYSFARERALADAISDIGRDLNSQYILSYAPDDTTKKEPGFHTIRVAVDHPGWRIRTRPGYWWGGGNIQ